MSRLDQNSTIQQEVIWDDGIKDILGEAAGIVKEEKVVIIDADSIIWAASYTGINEEGVKNPEYTEEDYEVAEGVLADNILKILLKIEQYFIISHLYVVVKGKGNFRKKLCSVYKSKRPPSPPIISHLTNYVIEKYDAVVSKGAEADDYCYSISSTINHQGILVSQDHDFDQIPSIIYNYRKDTWKRIDEKNARYHLALSTLVGCPGDSIAGVVGIGPKKAERIINREMTDFQYMRNIYKTYIQCYKEQAREKLQLMYNLLKLHNIEDLPKIKEI